MERNCTVFIGTYTESIRFGTGQVLNGKGKGIYCYELDTDSGAMRLICENTGIVNPSYLTLSNDGSRLYAVNELKEFGGQASGAVSSFSVDPRTNQLTFLNQRATGGTDPCHVVLNNAGTHAFVSNFMSGSVCVYPIAEDGSLKERSQFIQHEGSSVNPKRQTGPHAHSLIFDASNHFAFVPDLGMDKVMIYRTDFNQGILVAGESPYFATQPGSGPRHCVFSLDGRYAYLINELASSISALSYDNHAGSFTPLQTISTVMVETREENTCADVQIHPSGKFLYGSNRGHNSIVIYAVDPASGLLSYVDTQPCGGEIPRNFAIDPTGTWLLAANQDTDNIAVFRIDSANGILTQVSDVKVPTPVCVKFFCKA